MTTSSAGNPIDRVLALLEQPRSSGRDEWSALCPAHDDTEPSLSIGIGRDGQALLTCHRDCTIDAILTALHLSMSDLWPPRATNGKATIEATYDYVDETGDLLFQVVRQRKPDGAKKFVQRRPDGTGGWVWDLKGVTRVLYRLPAVLGAVGAGQLVWIVEGEKDVHALEAEGETATTNPHGAGKWRPEYSTTLDGARVRIVADKDAPGRRHAHAVAAALAGHATSIDVVEWPTHKDTAEHLGAGGTLDAHVPCEKPADDIGADHTPPEPPPPGDDELALPSEPWLPVVVINGRPPAEVTTQLLGVLVDANDPPELFIRAGRLTRVRFDENGKPIIELLGVNELRYRIARTTRPMRATKVGDLTHVFCPLDACQDILVHPAPPFPPLEAVIEIPALRPDGTIHDQAGYDQLTRLLHVPGGLHVPTIAEHPTDEEVGSACDLIVGELLRDFPFDTDADRANAVALLLTPFIRPATPGQVPLALLDAPEPGTGKGLLANIAAVIATGRPAAARPLAQHDDEIRKMLTAVLLEGPAIVVLDNIEDAIRSPSLAAVLTTDEWTDRILGRTETIAVPNRATWIATGNNLHVAGDIARRCYRIRLDAHQARPYTRTGFAHPDLIDWTRANRGRLVHALLTIARAWYAAGRPAAPDVPVIGGFTPWASTLAGILHHAGIAGFLANLDQLRDSIDLETESWEVFITALLEVYGDKQVTVAQIVQEIDSDYSNLRDHVPADLADWIGRAGFARRLGGQFLKREGRRYGMTDLAVLRAGKTRNKVVLWAFRSLQVEENPATPALFDESAGLRGTAGSDPSNADLISDDPRNSYVDGGEHTPRNPATPRATDGHPGPTEPEF